MDPREVEPWSTTAAMLRLLGTYMPGIRDARRRTASLVHVPQSKDEWNAWDDAVARKPDVVKVPLDKDGVRDEEVSTTDAGIADGTMPVLTMSDVLTGVPEEETAVGAADSDGEAVDLCGAVATVGLSDGIADSHVSVTTHSGAGVGESALEGASDISTRAADAARLAMEAGEADWSVDVDLNNRIALWCGIHPKGDVLGLRADAIVVPASQALDGLGGGLYKDTFKKGGVEFAQAAEASGPLKFGQVAVTPGFKLHASYVIHAVVPKTDALLDRLREAYTNALAAVKEHGFRTVAFAPLGTGDIGISLGLATKTALSVVREWLEDADNRACVDRIVFCCRTSRAHEVYEQLLQTFFPCGEVTAETAPDTLPTHSHSEVATPPDQENDADSLPISAAVEAVAASSSTLSADTDVDVSGASMPEPEAVSEVGEAPVEEHCSVLDLDFPAAPSGPIEL